MRRILLGVGLFIACLILKSGSVNAAEEEKPLAPGWFSLDCCVGVADKAIGNAKAVVEKALGLSISGFLDGSFTWSSNHPRSPSNISGRYFDKDDSKVVFNNFNLTVDKPEKDWGVGFHIVGDFGRTGELLREATLWGKALHKEPSAELREAYLTTTIPIGEGLQVKGGKFVTPMGTEVLPAPGAYNDNISRSFAFNYGVPLTHTGVMVTYPFTKILSANAALITGWDDPYDNNHVPSFMGGINFTPADAFALASNIMVGPEQWGKDGRQRVTWSNVATIKPIDPLTMYVEYTLGAEGMAPTPTGTQDSWWHALSVIGSYNWTERFNTALRGELFYDAQGSRVGGFPSNKPISNAALGEFTLTTSDKFTKRLLGRAEVRQDWANRTVFLRGNSTVDNAQTTLAVQLIYTF